MTTQNNVGDSPKIAFVTSLTQVTASTDRVPDLEGVGTTRVDQYGNRYRWVKNQSATVACRANAPVCYDATLLEDDTFLQVVVGPAIADADVNFFAGIAMGAIPASGYGWILTSGIYEEARMAGSETGTGTAVALVGDKLVASTYTTTTGTNSTRPYAFVANIAGADVVGTGEAGTVTLTHLTRPGAYVLSADKGKASGTVPDAANVFVRGLIP